ncbi:hypothetical protein BH11BAC5_BH11BAC5_48650 [soil metagenome]
MKNEINESDFPFKNSNFSDGNGFAKMYFNHISSNLEDLLKELTDRQLLSIIAVSKTLTVKNTSALNMFCKNCLKDFAAYILNQREKEAKYSNDYNNVKNDKA